MSELKLPLDFERLPEFRRLRGALAREGCPCPDLVALGVFVRLWVDLGYNAGTRPGYLSAESAVMLVDSLDVMVLPEWKRGKGAEEKRGEPVDPVNSTLVFLAKEGLIKMDEAESHTPFPLCPSAPFLSLLTQSALLRPDDDGWFCDRFAHFNAHLNAHYLEGRMKGTRHSNLSAQSKRLERQSEAGLLLLPPEIFERADGQVMNADEVKAATLVIRNIDNALGLPSRAPGAFTAGLMADACTVAGRFAREALKEIYFFINDHASPVHHPALPRTTEQVLANFEGVLKMRRNNK